MAYYDDPQFKYTEFWRGRGYEHGSEILALEKLLGGQKCKVAADIGGGFGRLSTWLAKHCQKVYLVEPSAKMRQLARQKLGQHSKIVIRSGMAQNTNLPARCVNVAVMVRVIHHLPQPESALAEMYRILKPGGLLVLEFASSLHLLARLKSWLRGRPVLLVPIERRSPENVAAATIPFMNHHPVTVQKQLIRQGFKVLKVLSVSNLRLPIVKKILPSKLLLDLELLLQERLASLYFGPSIFILAQKIDK